jgi:hypothetical protein
MAEISKVKAAAFVREKYLQSGSDGNAGKSSKPKLEYELVTSIHELTSMESSTTAESIAEYKKKTKELLERLLVKLEKSVSSQQLMAIQLRMKDEQLQAVQNELEMSRELFAREQRIHRSVTDTYKRDLQRAETFLRKLGSQLHNLNNNFRVMDDEEDMSRMEDPLQAEEEHGEEGNRKSEWEFGDCDIDSNVDYSELLYEDDFANNAEDMEDGEKSTASAIERKVLSPVTPGVSRRRSVHRKESLHAAMTRRSSFLQQSQSFLPDTQGELDATEIVMLPGEEEIEFSKISTSVKKNCPHNRHSSLLVSSLALNPKQQLHNLGRRKSHFGGRHSLLQPKNRRNSQARLSWIMPSLIATEDSLDDHSVADTTNEIRGRNCCKFQYDLQNDLENCQQASNRTKCASLQAEKGWKKMSELKVDDPWLRGIKGNGAMPRERHADVSCRRASLNNVVSVDHGVINVPNWTADTGVNSLRPALRLPSPNMRQ